MPTASAFTTLAVDDGNQLTLKGGRNSLRCTRGRANAAGARTIFIDTLSSCVGTCARCTAKSGSGATDGPCQCFKDTHPRADGEEDSSCTLIGQARARPHRIVQLGLLIQAGARE